MAEHRFPDMDLSIILDKVHILHVQDYETEQHVISYFLEPSVRRLDAKVVIVDSIAANFRGDEQAAKLKFWQKAKALQQMARSMKHVADVHQCAVVC